MGQFPSVKERRANTYGAGIVARTPRPEGIKLGVNPEGWIDETPYPYRIKQAAMVEKFRLYGHNYSNIANRYIGEDRWQAKILPNKYGLEEGKLRLNLLWRAYLAGQERAYNWNYWAEGDKVPNIPGPPDYYTINYAKPAWGPDQLRAALDAEIETAAGWTTLEDGSFSGAVIEKGPWHARYETQDPAETDLTKPAQDRHYTGDATLDGVSLDTLLMIQQLLVWGECAAPDRVGSEVDSCPQMEPGENDGEWLDWLQYIGGRVLWQMAYVEYQIMVDDMLNDKPGGHGGTVGEGNDRNPRALTPSSVNATATVITPVDDPGTVIIKTMLKVGGFIDDVAKIVVAAIIGE